MWWIQCCFCFEKYPKDILCYSTKSTNSRWNVLRKSRLGPIVTFMKNFNMTRAVELQTNKQPWLYDVFVQRSVCGLCVHRIHSPCACLHSKSCHWGRLRRDRRTVERLVKAAPHGLLELSAGVSNRSCWLTLHQTPRTDAAGVFSPSASLSDQLM